MLKNCPKCFIDHSKPGKFCSHTCANSRGSRTQDFKNKVSTSLKKFAKNSNISCICVQCHNSYFRKSALRIDKANFCSKSCTAEYRYIKLNPDKIRIKRNNIKTHLNLKINYMHCSKIFLSDNVNSTFCSINCGKKIQKKEILNEWITGNQIGVSESVPALIRNYMFEENNSKCQKCGWGKTNPFSGKIPLTINHINGNGTDHQRSNLELICPSCHSLTHNYCALNKGNPTRKGRADWRKRKAREAKQAII